MVAVPVDVCSVLLTRVAAGRHQVPTRDDAPGHSSIGGSPRWAYCAISGEPLSRYPISQGLSAAFFSARVPPWAGKRGKSG